MNVMIGLAHQEKKQRLTVLNYKEIQAEFIQPAFL